MQKQGSNSRKRVSRVFPQGIAFNQEYSFVHSPELRRQLNNAKRIVVKIGTDVITKNSNPLDKELDLAAMRHIVRQIGALHSNFGKQVIIVTSGAVGSGKNVLSNAGKNVPSDITGLRLAKLHAAVGQPALMQQYVKLFDGLKKGIAVAQVLPSRNDFNERNTKIVVPEFQQGIEDMLKTGIIPIINENDPLSTA